MHHLQTFLTPESLRLYGPEPKVHHQNNEDLVLIRQPQVEFSVDSDKSPHLSLYDTEGSLRAVLGIADLQTAGSAIQL